MANPVTDADAVRSALEGLLPSWVFWLGPVVSLLVTIALSALAVVSVRAIGFRAVRRAQHAHWTERARLALLGQSALILLMVMVPLVLATASLYFRGPLSSVSEAALAGASLLVSFSIVAGGYVATLRELRRIELSFFKWLWGIAVAAVVVIPGLPATFVLASWAPDALDGRFYIWLAVATITIAACAIGLPLLVARALGVVRDAPEKLANAVQAAARRVGHAPRAVYVLPWTMVNAVAFPSLDRLAFTTAAVDALTDAELEAIAAHEIAHLQEPASIRRLRIGLGMLWLPIAAASTIVAAFGMRALLATIAVCALIWLWGIRVRHRMEERADAIAAHGEHVDGTYARALERLCELNLLPAVLSGPQVHPSLYDRLTASGVTPDYPRPAPPSRYQGSLLAWGVLLATVGALALVVLVRNLAYGRGSETQILVELGLGGEAGHLGALAEERAEAGRQDEALLLHRAALELGSGHYAHTLELAELEASLGHCDAANHALERAREQLPRFDSSGRQSIERAERAIAACGRSATGAEDAAE